MKNRNDKRDRSVEEKIIQEDVLPELRYRPPALSLCISSAAEVQAEGSCAGGTWNCTSLPGEDSKSRRKNALNEATLLSSSPPLLFSLLTLFSPLAHMPTRLSSLIRICERVRRGGGAGGSKFTAISSLMCGNCRTCASWHAG